MFLNKKIIYDDSFLSVSALVQSLALEQENLVNIYWTGQFQ